MVERKTLIYWGTILFIGFFFLEFFVPLLYAPSATVTPTPTVAPEDTSFQGTGHVMSVVNALGSSAFVSCPGFDSLSANSTLVKGVISLGGNSTYSVELAQNVSSEAFSGFLALKCGSSAFLRSAFVSFNESLVVKDATGRQQVITPEGARSYASSSGLSGLPAFVLPCAKEGAVLNLTASLNIQGGQVTDFRLIEE